MSENPSRSAEPSIYHPDQVMQIVQQSILGLWDVVNNLTRLRPRRLDKFHVTIFGSARITRDMQEYADIKRLASELSTMGCTIVTGGGPGLMQAANEGAHEADPEDKRGSVGIRVQLPFEQGVNAFVGQAYEHRTFFTRLHHFVMISDVFVVVPGGIGTALEMFMIWQLLQVKKLYDTPLILVGPMWADAVQWATSHMTTHEPPLADPVDMTIPRCVANIDEAMVLVRDRYQQWQQEDSEGV